MNPFPAQQLSPWSYILASWNRKRNIDPYQNQFHSSCLVPIGNQFIEVSFHSRKDCCLLILTRLTLLESFLQKEGQTGTNQEGKSHSKSLMEKEEAAKQRDVVQATLSSIKRYRPKVDTATSTNTSCLPCASPSFSHCCAVCCDAVPNPQGHGEDGDVGPSPRSRSCSDGFVAKRSSPSTHNTRTLGPVSRPSHPSTHPCANPCAAEQHHCERTEYCVNHAIGEFHCEVCIF